MKSAIDRQASNVAIRINNEPEIFGNHVDGCPRTNFETAAPILVVNVYKILEFIVSAASEANKLSMSAGLTSPKLLSVASVAM